MLAKCLQRHPTSPTPTHLLKVGPNQHERVIHSKAKQKEGRHLDCQVELDATRCEAQGKEVPQWWSNIDDGNKREVILHGM